MPSVKEVESLKSEVEELKGSIAQTQGVLAQLKKGRTSLSTPDEIRERLVELEAERVQKEEKFARLMEKYRKTYLEVEGRASPE